MKPLNLTQATQMLALQDKMNVAVAPDWLQRDFPFLRAVVVEAGEALDHLGWKWWKKQEPDLQQVIIEFVDILHFFLSHFLMQVNGDIQKAAQLLTNCSNPLCSCVDFDGKKISIDKSDLRSLIELLAGLAVARRAELPVLEACFWSVGISWDDVVVQYISKNVLNIFRQKNGYKEGTYIKTWDGKEDNVRLIELLEDLDVKSDNFSDDLFIALTRRYSTVGSQA